MVSCEKLNTLSDDEDTQQKSHNFVAFVAQVSLEEVNQELSKYTDSCSNEGEDFLDFQTAYDALL